MSSFSRNQLEAWLKTITVNGRVLDIGSSQKGLQGRLKSFEAMEYIGLDLEKPHEGEQANIVCDINYPIEFV